MTHRTTADYFAGIPRQVEPIPVPVLTITPEQYNEICQVIDRVKMDARSLDTNEYADMIEAILTQKESAR